MSSVELPKTYEPHDVEDKWIQKWLDADIFAPDLSQANNTKSFSMVIPPPNVTGSLHMGHALNNTVQDILARYHRMQGYATLWVVGTDHAGIATQNVVEKQLAAEGKTRFDLGREKFVERVWQWKKESGGTIINQLKRLGASCDFSNERFTMDEGLSEAVKKVFVDLYQQGLIYRGQRLINWCPRCQTALSDLEVEHENQKGHLWNIKYPLVDGSGFLVIATTRPETLLGDTAVAVHPEDERYQKFVGQKVKLPLTDREILIIADDYVDQEFGSGVVKITPAHDFNDFEVGKRHDLEAINILTPDGKVAANGGSYAGLAFLKARQNIVDDLEKAELLGDIEDHQNAVGHCYRCKTIVEPYLSFQWFVKAKPLADKALAAVKDGRTRFVPQHWEKTYFNWMENIQDWCVSRQIWWGHQIPAWYCSNAEAKGCEVVVASKAPDKCPHCGSDQLVQEQDVLDTWFSSALWPFSTMGWPESTDKLKTFYPTSSLVTAFDIIFFWVARMMMMGLHFMNEVPFKDVHIHALVRDPLGQKMSKSKGNVVDPLLMMKKYGTDAFRFTLAAFAAQGRDIKLDEARISGYRNFCNKIWNASRFAMMSAANFIQSPDDFKTVDPQNRLNQWILVELDQCIQKTTQAIETYEFNRGALALYSFFWHAFCDWYIEFTKLIFNEGTQAEKIETAQTVFYVLDNSLRLLHPFMPFITEEIWHMLGDRGETSIAQADFPTKRDTIDSYQQSWQETQLLSQTIFAIRSIRQETGVALTQAIVVKILPSADSQKLYPQIEAMILKLGGVSQIEYLDQDPSEPAAVAKAGDSLVVIPLQGIIDAGKEKTRQEKRLAKVGKDIMQLEKSLNNPKFVSNAPAELLEEKKELYNDVLEQKALIEKAIELLS